jgi:hypothetical protein
MLAALVLLKVRKEIDDEVGDGPSSVLDDGTRSPCPTSVTRDASARFASASDPGTVRYARLIARCSSRPADTVSFQTPGDSSRFDPCPR